MPGGAQRLRRGAIARIGVLGALGVLAAASSSCVIFERKLELPKDDVPTALMLSMPLLPPMEDVARHPWFAVRGEGEATWERWEIWGHGQWGHVRRSTGGPLEGDGDVQLHGVLRGNKAQRFIDCLREKSPVYEHKDDYRVWPGPNSNTYVDIMMRRCGFKADLPPASVGKDYRGIFGASWTSGGTGFQIESPLFGFRLGLKEGLEIHIFALAIGIDWWPPAIITPAGRIGFADR